MRYLLNPMKTAAKILKKTLITAKNCNLFVLRVLIIDIDKAITATHLSWFSSLSIYFFNFLIFKFCVSLEECLFLHPKN